MLRSTPITHRHETVPPLSYLLCRLSIVRTFPMLEGCHIGKTGPVWVCESNRFIDGCQRKHRNEHVRGERQGPFQITISRRDTKTHANRKGVGTSPTRIICTAPVPDLHRKAPADTTPHSHHITTCTAFTTHFHLLTLINWRSFFSESLATFFLSSW